VSARQVQRTMLGAAIAVVLAMLGGAAPAAAADPICPRQRDACVERLILDMRRSYARLGCDHNTAFALLYWRTTEGIRDALRAGAFSDRRLWNQVTTAFGRYYLDAFTAWRGGERRKAPEAWRIAFRAAERERVSTLGDLFLGINAHVNRDLAFVYYRFRVRSHADHLQVNTVLTRVRPVVFPEIIAKLDPTLALQSSGDPGLSLDIFAWRELAWRNARRLARAHAGAPRRAVAAGIERHAVAMARRIEAAFPATRAADSARDAFCRRTPR
jgi:Family of unknown function (DUF5995)